MFAVLWLQIQEHKILQTQTLSTVKILFWFFNYNSVFKKKARQAEIRGAKGIILYSDPEEYADDSENTDVYPHDWFLPESGTQRGSIYIGIGDPLTPGYPATGHFTNI